MSKETTPQHRLHTAVIPQLKDPKHPGMFLVSRIALFSLSLFMILFVLLLIVGDRITLNFELNATAHFRQEQLWVTIDEKQASVFEPGDEVVIHYENGLSVMTSVSQISAPSRGKISMMVTVKSGALSGPKKEASGQDISLSLQQPLRAYMIRKLGG